MPRRQTIPVDEVRAPPFINDQMSPGQVRQGLSTQTSLQDLINIVASQLRIVSGSTGWLDAPPPGATSAFTGDLVTGERLDGVRDGVNAVFATGHTYLSGTLTVFLNGQSLTSGSTADYIAVEAAGPGTGFNAVKLTGMVAPLPRDVLQATYVRVA